MAASVYLESTVISYLAARPAADLIAAAHQRITHDWWEKRRGEFALYVSQVVISETSGGDGDAAERRLRFIEGIEVLHITSEATALSKLFIGSGMLPKKAEVDALHVALATTNGIDFLLTWNCSHIANALFREPLTSIAAKRGYRLPVICTPEELLER